MLPGHVGKQFTSQTLSEQIFDFGTRPGIAGVEREGVFFENFTVLYKTDLT